MPCAMTWERCSTCVACLIKTRDRGEGPALVLVCRAGEGELVVTSCPVGRGEAPIASEKKKPGRKPGTSVSRSKASAKPKGDMATQPRASDGLHAVSSV